MENKVFRTHVILFFLKILWCTYIYLNKKKGKIVGSYLSFINLNLIVEFGRTAVEEILNIFCYFSGEK